MTYASEAWIRALQRTAAIERNPRVTLATLIAQLADRFDTAPALESSDDAFSYRDLSCRCNQYAHWGASRGLRAGDVVALCMPNCAEYLAAWLGLTRLGVIVALVNTHLTGELLGSAVRLASPRLLVAGAPLAEVLRGARSHFPAGLACWVRGGSAPATDFDSMDSGLLQQPATPLAELDHPAPTLDATALYIYTSGTTGLPKAARVSHYRLMQWSHWFAGLMDITPQDRMYDCLPLYHSVGGVVAAGATLVGGGTVVIRQRFSAADFWRDVRDRRCTLFQYIGELCRYLANSPEQPAEREHALRLACGNGLRPEVWRVLEERFRIPRILEYYASTEGNFSLYNCEGEPGAIGRIPAFLTHRLPVELVRVDGDSGDVYRDAAGRCERCADGEAGEAIGLIPGPETGRMGRFEGYADAAASGRKVLRDVFAPGDSWYRTGDLMRRDARGFYYFVDRIGDTYRWKGENVSTAEVLSVLTSIAGVVDGVVYGVPVAGTEGRAGMAALIVQPAFDLAAFREALTIRLPAYARPVFLRLLPRLDATATFKPIKHLLATAGFNPALIGDSLYVDSREAGAFVPLDPPLHEQILAGRMRL